MISGRMPSFLNAVDGMVGGNAMKLSTLKNGLAGNRSIRARVALDEWEVRFLEYRLEVVGSWPDSGRKLATIEAIMLRLERSHSHQGS
jgi:hypothetical protein